MAMLGDSSSESAGVAPSLTDCLNGLEMAEKSGEMTQGEDEDNKFLNSSSFLSHSQIIRSTNVTNFKPTIPNAMSSPTRNEHFQLFQKEASSQIFTESDHTDEEEAVGEDEGSPKMRFIDIDDPRSTPKLPKMHAESTAWRRLRPQSSIRVKEVQKPDVMSMNYVHSLFDSGDPASTRSPTRAVSLFETASVDSLGTNNTTEVESLRKQVTNYKLQQRVLTEVIREILNRSGNGDQLKSEIMQKLEVENDLLTTQRESLQNELKRGEAGETSRFNDEVKKVLELKNDLISTKELNDNLQLYIDELKQQLTTQEETINSLVGDADLWAVLLNEILSVLLHSMEGESSRAVQQARDDSTSTNTRLNVVKFAVCELGRKCDELSDRLNGANDENEPLSAQLRNDLYDKLSTSKCLEKELEQLLDQQSTVVSALRSEVAALQQQYNETLQFSGSLRKLLNEKRQNISGLNEYILELEAQIDELNGVKGTQDQAKETKLLKNRLTIVKSNHSKDVERLEGEIERLTLDADNRGNLADLREGLTKKELEIAELQAAITTLNTQLSERERDHENTVTLKRALQSSRDDYESLLREFNDAKQTLKRLQDHDTVKEREYRRKLEHAAKELNTAVTKQRTLAAEKSKLTFALEDAKRDRSNLTLNNNTLTDKVGRLSYQLSSLTSYEVGFKSLFELQIHHLQNMFQDFEPVLEKSSYTQAQQKLSKLSESDLDFEKTHAIVRSLLAFFENAMESLIDDHRQLMINGDGDLSGENDELERQVATLQEELQWYHENDKDGNSPRTKLRIIDLEKKRKAERERRKLEFEESQKLVSKLEQENKVLKEKLAKLQK